LCLLVYMKEFSYDEYGERKHTLRTAFFEENIMSFIRQSSDMKRAVCEKQLAALAQALRRYDTVMIGAGAGLSTSAGYTYSGERFQRYFRDFAERYGFTDMYTGGFHNFRTQEEFWAYWSRNIYINRYIDAPTDLYRLLFELVKGKEYFVLTTNVDHCFQKAGFDKQRMFYTQGDYGLFQCSEPCCKQTWDNRAMIEAMVKDQGYVIEADGTLTVPDGTVLKMDVSSGLLPKCPVCGKPLTMNLRCDDRFVEDAGWHAAARRYQQFMLEAQGKPVLYLELGVGYNTPGIIKYPFWQRTYENPDAMYVCLNKGQAIAPKEIADRSICIDDDVARSIMELRGACNESV